MQEVSVLFFGHRDALEHKNQGAPRGAHVDRLVGGVQHEHGSKQSMAVSGAMRRYRIQASGVPGYCVVLLHP